MILDSLEELFSERRPGIRFLAIEALRERMHLVGTSSLLYQLIVWGLREQLHEDENALVRFAAMFVLFDLNESLVPEFEEIVEPYPVQVAG